MQILNDPSRIAEDECLRSRHMWELVHDPGQTNATPGPADIPKVIVQFWHDSCAIPADVRQCLDSWQPLTEQGFSRVFFDDNEARRFIATRFGDRYVAAFDRCGHPAMRCDYFRLCYILRHGGFYVDADEVYQGADCDSLFLDHRLKLQPLCYDPQTDTMVRTDVFIGNRT